MTTHTTWYRMFSCLVKAIWQSLKCFKRAPKDPSLLCTAIVSLINRSIDILDNTFLMPFLFSFNKKSSTQKYKNENQFYNKVNSLHWSHMCFFMSMIPFCLCLLMTQKLSFSLFKYATISFSMMISFFIFHNFIWIFEIWVEIPLASCKYWWCLWHNLLSASRVLCPSEHCRTILQWTSCILGNDNWEYDQLWLKNFIQSRYAKNLAVGNLLFSEFH